jgi:hypothetical protein
MKSSELEPVIIVTLTTLHVIISFRLNTFYIYLLYFSILLHSNTLYTQFYSL